MKMTIRATLLVSSLFLLTACGESVAVDASVQESPVAKSDVSEKIEIKRQSDERSYVPEGLIDGSSGASFEASTSKIAASMPGDYRRDYREDLAAIYAIEADRLADTTPVDEITGKVYEIMGKKLHGKSVEDVAAIAKEMMAN